MYFQVEINLSFQIGKKNRVYIHLSLLRKHLVFLKFFNLFYGWNSKKKSST